MHGSIYLWKFHNFFFLPFRITENALPDDASSVFRPRVCLLPWSRLFFSRTCDFPTCSRSVAENTPGENAHLSFQKSKEGILHEKTLHARTHCHAAARQRLRHAKQHRQRRSLRNRRRCSRRSHSRSDHRRQHQVHAHRHGRRRSSSAALRELVLEP